MNQKNIFTVIGVILLFEGIGMYTMGNKITSDSFPNLEANGHFAVVNLIEVMAMWSIIVGFISFATRNVPGVLWAYTLGFAFLGLVTLKHIFKDHINVPVFDPVIQLGISVACCYLWMKSSKSLRSKAQNSKPL
jgi:hypothetical protein